MCLTEARRYEHEEFIQSAVKKQQRNKRKREPNMYVAAVLECTVRRICSEVSSSYFCLCTPPKRRRLSSSEDKKETSVVQSSGDQQDKSKSNNCTLNSSDRLHFSCEFHESIELPETPQTVPADESEVENFLHSLTIELAELPSFDEVDGLLKEIEWGSDFHVVEEEIGEMLKRNCHDPFYPGLFEVLFDQLNT